MVTDDDTAAIVLSATSALTLTEGDDTGVSYTVKLATQPSETVTVTIGGHAGTDLSSVTGTTLSGSDDADLHHDELGHGADRNR